MTSFLVSVLFRLRWWLIDSSWVQLQDVTKSQHTHLNRGKNESQGTTYMLYFTHVKKYTDVIPHAMIGASLLHCVMESDAPCAALLLALNMQSVIPETSLIYESVISWQSSYPLLLGGPVHAGRGPPSFVVLCGWVAACVSVFQVAGIAAAWVVCLPFFFPSFSSFDFLHTIAGI